MRRKELCDEDYKKAMQEIITAGDEVKIKLCKFLALRKKMHPENDWQQDDFWNKFSDFYADNMKVANDWVRNDCSADDFSWLSEVFEDIAEKSQSKDFINCIEETSKKFPEECEKYSIMFSIECAKGMMND